MSIPVFPAIVSTWRAAKVRELREHAAKVRAAYTAPNITAHTFAYADALERAADVLADEALTVGQALADARVQSGEYVVEFCDATWPAPWWQFRADADDDGIVMHRFWNVDEWTERSWNGRLRGRFIIRACWFALPCRLVPLLDADAPPESRGSM